MCRKQVVDPERPALMVSQGAPWRYRPHQRRSRTAERSRLSGDHDAIRDALHHHGGPSGKQPAKRAFRGPTELRRERGRFPALNSAVARIGNVGPGEIRADAAIVNELGGDLPGRSGDRLPSGQLH